MQREQRRSSRVIGRALAFSGALALAFTGSGAAFAGSTNSVAAAEWALNTLNVTQVRNLGAHGAGVVVAVIDTGVDPNQPDLTGRLVDGVNLTDPDNPTSDYSDTDSKSHGTSVATVVAGFPHTDSSGSAYGVIGLADKAEIMPIKVSADGTASSPSIAAGIEYAVSHGAQVINLSIGSPSGSSDVTDAVNMALAHGVVVAVAASNDANSGNSVNALADIPGVLDVAGIDSNGQKYSFGHSGPDVNIAAPANSIEVGIANGQYDENSGTSFATPWVSGEAALLIAAHPTWTSGQIVAAIIDNTQQVANGTTKSGQRYNDDFGYGVIDPVAALQASEPSSAANPLGGPAITSNPAENVKNSASASASATSGTTPTATAGKSSSKMPLIIGIVVGVVVLVGLLIFVLSRGNRNRGGKGGPGGGGGGGGNGYYPPQAPPPGGGQYGQQAPGQYGQPQAPQYQPPQTHPYPQQQPQQPQPGYPPQQGQGGPGGYGQQNPYSGR